MKNKAKKIGIVVADIIAVILFVFFHLAIIVALGVILTPLLLWKWIKGDE